MNRALSDNLFDRAGAPRTALRNTNTRAEPTTVNTTLRPARLNEAGTQKGALQVTAAPAATIASATRSHGQGGGMSLRGTSASATSQPGTGTGRSGDKAVAAAMPRHKATTRKINPRGASALQAPGSPL